jgi:transposase-like protein
MARRVGPVKAHRYTVEFKLKAVKLSSLKGVQVQDVAEALDIHPIMLTRRRGRGDCVVESRRCPGSGKSGVWRRIPR